MLPASVMHPLNRYQRASRFEFTVLQWVLIKVSSRGRRLFSICFETAEHATVALGKVRSSRDLALFAYRGELKAELSVTHLSRAYANLHAERQEDQDGNVEDPDQDAQRVNQFAWNHEDEWQQ